MFKRPHHRDIALVLQCLDAAALRSRACYFGGGTAMALKYGEYRESVDIDFLTSNLHGYRELRRMLADGRTLQPILRPGLSVEVVRDVRADQYGIRTLVRSGGAEIKFEIVLEARIELSTPGTLDMICGVTTLAEEDLAAEKLLANADRWNDDAVFSRDLIDLALQRAAKQTLEQACQRAEVAYGDSVRKTLHKAIDALARRPQRLDECMSALRITTVTKAQLWQAIIRVGRALKAPPTTPPLERS